MIVINVETYPSVALPIGSDYLDYAKFVPSYLPDHCKHLLSKARSIVEWVPGASAEYISAPGGNVCVLMPRELGLFIAAHLAVQRIKSYFPTCNILVHAVPWLRALLPEWVRPIDTIQDIRKYYRQYDLRRKRNTTWHGAIAWKTIPWVQIPLFDADMWTIADKALAAVDMTGIPVPPGERGAFIVGSGITSSSNVPGLSALLEAELNKEGLPYTLIGAHDEQLPGLTSLLNSTCVIACGDSPLALLGAALGKPVFMFCAPSYGENWQLQLAGYPHAKLSYPSNISSLDACASGLMKIIREHTPGSSVSVAKPLAETAQSELEMLSVPEQEQVSIDVSDDDRTESRSTVTPRVRPIRRRAPDSED